MTKTIVFSDMHNREFVVKDLFRKVGLMDSDGNRNPGFKTIQLGDLLSMGYGEQEAQFLSWIREGKWIDTQLVGNHEYPSVGPYPDRMMFVGYDERDIVAEQLLRSEFNKARMENDPNLWVAAASVGDYLITHAGLSIAAQKELTKEGWDGSAKGAADLLNELWIDHVTNATPDPLFISTSEHMGGIFWIRNQYIRAGYRSQHVNQMYGHTPVDHNPKFKPPSVQNRDGNLWCIDTVGDCCAMVTEDDGKTWDMVRSDYEVRFWENPRGKRGGGPVYVRGTDMLASV